MPPEPTPDGSPTLAAALTNQAIDLPAEQVALLDRYCQLVWEWNEKLNLTRHTDYDKFVSRDVVDSREIAACLEPKERIIDVGTGGGVPGVLLAILRPDLRVTLSESVGKKARAVTRIVADLGLKVPVHAGRAEDLLQGQHLSAGKGFDTLVVRAVAPLAKLLTWFRPFLGSFRRLLIVKGPAWVEERQEAREKNLLKGLQLRKLATWPLPGTHSESVLLEIKAQEKDR
jgi:16S rRNA (guanine527-N7)-methyltransferase